MSRRVAAYDPFGEGAGTRPARGGGRQTQQGWQRGGGGTPNAPNRASAATNPFSGGGGARGPFGGRGVSAQPLQNRVSGSQFAASAGRDDSRAAGLFAQADPFGALQKGLQAEDSRPFNRGGGASGQSTPFQGRGRSQEATGGWTRGGFGGGERQSRGGGGGGRACVFFAQGRCREGASCRFSHEGGGAEVGPEWGQTVDMDDSNDYAPQHPNHSFPSPSFQSPAQASPFGGFQSPSPAQQSTLTAAASEIGGKLDREIALFGETQTVPEEGGGGAAVGREVVRDDADFGPFGGFEEEERLECAEPVAGWLCVRAAQ